MPHLVSNNPILETRETEALGSRAVHSGSYTQWEIGCVPYEFGCLSQPLDLLFSVVLGMASFQKFSQGISNVLTEYQASWGVVESPVLGDIPRDSFVSFCGLSSPPVGLFFSSLQESLGPYPLLLTPRQEPFQHLMKTGRPAHPPSSQGGGEYRMGGGHNTATRRLMWCPCLVPCPTACLFTFISPQLNPRSTLMPGEVNGGTWGKAK